MQILAHKCTAQLQCAVTVFVYMAHHHLPLRDLPPAVTLPVVAGAAGAVLGAAVCPGRAAGAVSAAPSMFINCSNQTTGLTRKCLSVESVSLCFMQKHVCLHEEACLLGRAW
jgi:hypothetical protein